MKTLIFTLFILCAHFAEAQEKAETTYDPQKDRTTVRSKSIGLSKDKDRYHTLDFTLHYSYTGQLRQLGSLRCLCRRRKANTLPEFKPFCYLEPGAGKIVDW